MRGKLFFLAGLLFVVTAVDGRQRLSVTDFGAVPDSRQDVLPAVMQAVAACDAEEGAVIDFPKGRYDFRPSCSGEGCAATVGFVLRGLKNVTVEGNGSEFVFHGNMQIALIDSCENVVFRNFSVDWDRPYISQAEIVEATDDFLDVRIDRNSYPYRIVNGRILFTGEGWELPVVLAYNNLYDAERKEIVPRTWDNPLGNIFDLEAEERGEGLVRFRGQPRMKPEKGTLVTLFHARYLTNGIHVRDSRQTLLQHLTVYHALSHGVLGEMSEDITLDHVSMQANEAKGRVFSIVADASHFINCKGVIKVEHCAHTGQGDDFINVHGRNVVIQSLVDARTVEVKMDGRYNRPGDEVWFLGRETAQRGEVRTVQALEPVYGDGRQTGYRISFTRDLPEGVKALDFLENKTWTASLELRNCRILKKHRARGILVTTPGEVIIENNYFRTAGTAILIEGDTDHWYESGASTNVQIRQNVFEDCLTSGNEHGDRWEWGDAVITVTPSHRPASETTAPYHRNIVIRDNVFRVFDAPLVRARSTGGLQFTGNGIVKTDTYPPYTWQKSAFLLDGCRDVVIRENRIDGRYTTRNIRIEHMRPSDVKTDGDFRVEM
ncbi:MAG: glycoside hydrolase family 55 protein [Tannerella sp.]|jgi:hypothetical protein|nr:glycoside hydrolase family 55 protein [Tannerella sp.]